jgi:LmbE family N-acetylglucosaminyl deacetylase
LDDLRRLAELVQQIAPQVALAPWLLDMHPKHRLTNHLLYLAHRLHGLPPFEVWGYQVNNPIFGNAYADITDVADLKRQMLACYASQNDHLQRFDHTAMGLAAWNSRVLPPGDTYPLPARYAELFFTLPQAEFFRFIEQFYFSDFKQTYHGKQRVIDGAVAIHQQAMSAMRKGNTG